MEMEQEIFQELKAMLPDILGVRAEEILRVNAVAPGMLTDGVSLNTPEKQQEDFRQHCTLGRSGTLEQVAELVAFLASDRSGYINAQTIHRDGGI